MGGCHALLHRSGLLHGTKDAQVSRRLAPHLLALAGSLPSKSKGAVPAPAACNSNPPILEMHAASRRWSAPAQHEARILLDAGAGSSRVLCPGKPTCAVPSQTDVPPRLPLHLAEVLAKLEAVLDKPRSSRSLEEEFGVNPGVAATGIQRGSHRRRIRRRRAPADGQSAEGPC